MSKFTFHLAGEPRPLSETDPAWREPLPACRDAQRPRDLPFLSIGEYFEAVETFLSEKNMERIVSAARQSGGALSPDNIETVSVFLEKHGEFYHPARVEVFADDKAMKFVLNVAVSRAGLSLAGREFALLKKMRGGPCEDFIPRVYEEGAVDWPRGENRSRMFLGEWFEGYHEFHVSSRGGGDALRVRVWDPDNPDRYLSEKQTFELYREVALILSCFYDLETFERIHPWHHAAGDFVVRLDQGRLRLKLITVRGVQALFRGDETDLGEVMRGLLAFLADLSIKNRIDRLDGVGEIAWAGDLAVPATIEGFFQGLLKKTRRNPALENIPDYFGLYLGSLEESSFAELFDDIVSTLPPQAPETAFIKGVIQAHASLFCRCAREYLASRIENIE